MPLAGYGASSAFWMADQPPTSRVGYSGAPQTISVMRKSCLDDANHFNTRQLCEAFCEGIQSKDYASECVAAYQFLLQHARYMRDPRRTELVRAPYIVSQQIAQGRTPSLDCDDMALWIASAIISMGGRAEFVTVAFSNMFYGDQRQYSHVFTRALEPRTRCWIVLDPVAAEKTPQMLRRVVAAETWPIAA